jgi:hypothetical protein
MIRMACASRLFVRRTQMTISGAYVLFIILAKLMATEFKGSVDIAASAFCFVCLCVSHDFTSQCHYYRNLRQFQQRVRRRHEFSLRNYAVISHRCSSISNFVVQAAVPKTAKVSLSFALAPHRSLHLQPIACVRVSQLYFPGHAVSCHRNVVVP